jgi:ribonuclease-3
VSGRDAEHTDEERFALAEAATRHTFADKSLLRRALTHPSYKDQTAPRATRKAAARAGRTAEPTQPAADIPAKADDYERLEFLGDAVISLVVAHELFVRFPDSPEGTLTKLKIGAVSGHALREAARDMGLADALFIGESERGTGGRGLASALENAFEALVAALYLDGGYEVARAFTLRALGEHIGQDVPVPAHPKSDLQEYLQARGNAPVYRLTAVHGPPHDRTFTAVVLIDGEESGTGVGRSKKEAEMRAAAEAIRRLGIADDGAAHEAD